MQFFEKQFQPSKGFTLVPTGVDSLATLIREHVDISTAFVVYEGDDITQLDAPIIGHAGHNQRELLAPIISYPGEDSHDQDKDGRRVYMLDMDEKHPKIIQVPTGIPLVDMRDSYRYQFAMQKFYTRQSVEQILAGLRKEGWEDFLYIRSDSGPIDFTPIADLRKDISKI